MRCSLWQAYNWNGNFSYLFRFRKSTTLNCIKLMEVKDQWNPRRMSTPDDEIKHILCVFWQANVYCMLHCCLSKRRYQHMIWLFPIPACIIWKCLRCSLAGQATGERHKKENRHTETSAASEGSYRSACWSGRALLRRTPVRTYVKHRA
jgi:hypothetical protein